MQHSAVERGVAALFLKMKLLHRRSLTTRPNLCMSMYVCGSTLSTVWRNLGMLSKRLSAEPELLL